MIRRTANPRTTKAYLTLKSDIGDYISWYRAGSTEYANVVIDCMEDLVRHEFDVILTKQMLKRAFHSNKSDLLQTLQKLRRWIWLKHSDTTRADPSSADYITQQCAIDLVQLTLLDVYNYILKTSIDVELGNSDARASYATKRGRFVQMSEFDLYAETLERAA